MKRKLMTGALATLTAVPVAATECVGHRGNNGEELENTYSALESAYAIGVPNIEFDIHHTRDGIAILSHDDNLRRVAQDRPGRSCPLRSEIGELSAQDILENCEMKNGDDVAVLDTVFDRFSARPTRILLELKDVPSERTLELVRSSYDERKDAIRVISKSADALTVARSYLGPDYRYFHIHRTFRGLNLDFDGVLNRRADAGQVGALTTEEFSTGTYTIDEPKDMVDYRDAGLTYVITDYPRLCMQTLAPG